MSDFSDLLHQGTAELLSTIGEPASLAIGKESYSVTAAVSSLPVAYPIALGGAVVECSATAIIPREGIPHLAPGAFLSVAGVTYEVARVSSASYDPTYRLELTRRRAPISLRSS